MANTKGLKPGTPAPNSGQYKEKGGIEKTIIKGKPLPPTSKPGGTYSLVDPTKNKSGGGK